MSKRKTGPFDLGGLTIGQLAKRVYNEISDDNVFDAAASLAYYFLLALFPLLIFLVSILSTIKSLDLVNTIMTTMSRTMPHDAFELLGKEVERILSDPHVSLLTLGALGTLWAASSGMVSLLGSLNEAYDVKEQRGFFKIRGVAVGLTFALALMIILGSMLLILGDKLAEWVIGWGGDGWIKTIGTVVNYILGLLLMFTGLEVVFYFGPDVKDQKWRWISPGSIVSVGLFVLCSIGFSLYIRFAGGYNATYGSLGGVIVLMLWLYLLGVAIMLGAEVNSEIAVAARARGNNDAPQVPITTPANPTSDNSSRESEKGKVQNAKSSSSRSTNPKSA